MEPMRIVPAVQGPLCVHPSGAYALSYHFSTFTKVDLTNGQQISMNAEVPKTFSAAKFRTNPTFVVRSSKHFVLCLLMDDDTKKVYVVLFSVNREDITIVNEQCSHLVGGAEKTVELHHVANGQVCVMSYYSIGSTTIFDDMRIDIDESGKITSSTSSRATKRSLNGEWWRPFIIADCYYWHSKNAASFLRKLLKVAVNSEYIAEIGIKNDLLQLPAEIPFSSTAVQVIGERYAIYISNKELNLGLIVVFEFKEGHRLILPMPLNSTGHAVFGATQLTQSRNGVLYVHGTCNADACKNAAHIFIIEVEKVFKMTQKILAALIDDDEDSDIDSARGSSAETTAISSASKYNQLSATSRSRENQQRLNERKGETADVMGAASKVAALTAMFNAMSAEGSSASASSHKREVQQQQPYGKQSNQICNSEQEHFMAINYEKIEEIGRGGFGIIYKCFDKDKQKYFAAKESISHGEEAIKTAQNEMDRLKRMSHPRIIQYYGFKIERGSIIIFMEYMAAGSIRQIIDKFGVIKEPASIKYIDQILDGLAYIHKIGIVHSDLKCSNILNDGQGNVKLGDFGIAVQKIINAANHSFFTHSAKGGGTLHWQSAEVMNGDGCSRRSDIWSLGCTIVEMLTGKPPYNDMSFLKFTSAIEQRRLSYNPNELVPKASDQMKKFLSNMLQIECEKRPCTAAEAIQIYKKIF